MKMNYHNWWKRDKGLEKAHVPVVNDDNKIQQIGPIKTPFIDWGVVGPLITLMVFTSSIFLINEQFLVSYMKEPYIQEVGLAKVVEFDLEFKEWARDVGIQRVQCSFEKKMSLASYVRIYDDKSTKTKPSLANNAKGQARGGTVNVNVNVGTSSGEALEGLYATDLKTNGSISRLATILPIGLCPKELGSNGFLWLMRSDLNVWSLWSTSSVPLNLESGSKDVEFLQNWIKSRLNFSTESNDFRKESTQGDKSKMGKDEFDSLAGVSRATTEHVIITNKSSPYLKAP